MKRTLLLTISLGLCGLSDAQNTGPEYVNNMVRAGQTINNTGSLEGTAGDSGLPFLLSSNTVNATVSKISSLNISIGGQNTSTAEIPGQSVTAENNGFGTVIYQLTNTGNSTDDVILNLTSDNPTNSTMWADLDGNGQLADAGEIVLNGQTVTLAAGQSVNIHVTESIGSNDAGRTRYVNQLTGTTDLGANDSDNYGAVTVIPFLSAILNDAYGAWIRPGQTMELINAKTLTNISNIPLNATNVRFNASESGPAGLLTISYAFDTAAYAASIQEAWELYVTQNGPLGRGAQIPVSIRAVAPQTGLSNNTNFLFSTVVEMIPESDELTIDNDTDFTEFEPRVFESQVLKAQSICTSENGQYTCGPMDDSDKVAAPCDVVIYGVTARATIPGSSIGTPILKDTLSPNLKLLFAQGYGSDNEANFQFQPTDMPTRIGGGTWILGRNVPTTDQPSVTVEAGYDWDGNNTINGNDVMEGSYILSLGIGAQVRGEGCSAFDPANATNMPTLPYKDGSQLGPIGGGEEAS